ncbi:type IV toxin-antitoxin system AbiEi family antitoxin domain-containing protein [Candidatus Ruminimicrobium bovinum]|uniref:type IV toxin-antitoxin system AbiEi family antitoxin domain-containing protein n=1 Tax=Candidatus Ruminimicrobium bovinum TaxID=3242779 RepID=UPI0039B88785
MNIKKIKEKFIKNNGILKSNQLYDLDLNYNDIQYLIEEDSIEKIRNGYYCLKGNNYSEEKLISLLFPTAVICMDSALFYYGYSDKTPLCWHIAVNKDISKAKFKISFPVVKPYYIEPKELEYGITTAKYKNCSMKIFDRDRLICECFKYEKKIDKELFNKAVQAYIKDSKKNIKNLLEYSKKRNIQKKAKNIIGLFL